VDKKLMGEMAHSKVKKMNRILQATAVTIGLTLLGSNATAQSFDPYSRDGARFTASIMAMHWLGLQQGVVESCNGDVRPNGQKLLNFLEAARIANGESFADTLGSIFFGGLRLGQGIGCDVDALRTYGEWADLYYAPALSEFRR